MTIKLIRILPYIFMLNAVDSYAKESISLNYGYGMVSGKSNMSGATVQYMHIPDALGVIGSATYLARNNNDGGNTKYASVLAGPAFMLSPDVYLYGMAGISSASKLKKNQTNELYGPAVSTGFNVYLSDNILFNIGFEISHVDSGTTKIIYTGLGYGF